MSGGSYNYAFTRVGDMAERVDTESEFRETWNDEVVQRPPEETPDRRKMAAILRQVSEAMRTLEWYDSGDIGDWDRVQNAFKRIPRFE